MAQELSASARKVQEVLAREGFGDLQVVELPASTRTAAEAATACGCEVGQIAKSLVFRAANSGQSVLVIASGANRVNEKRIGEFAGEPIERATPDFVREKTGFVIGGVPPVAHAQTPVTFVDEDLLGYAEIWAAAGTPNAVFKLTPDSLVKLTGGKIVSVK
jgi:prolyl-tRNA editing enzyme YbaK/EbsC (Cys-tRNA(Pro) deacylase)